MFGLQRFLHGIIRRGNLVVVDAGGREHRFGDGLGDEIRVRLHDRSLYLKLPLIPDPTLGDAYAKGRVTMEAGSIYDLLELAVSQMNFGYGYRWRTGGALSSILHRLGKLNTIARSKRNAAHHYDLKIDFYDLFLDADRQYSCAYFEDGESSLQRAQLAKKRHIAAKLDIAPGMRILDIGCGWGGLALYLAKICDAHVVGITLSAEQAEEARRRTGESGLEDRIEIRLEDYRELDERFDRIVSVGMFEHVGPMHYDEYFEKVRDLLHEDGVALVHTIGRPHGPDPTSPWIRKHIFPGGYLPALSEIQTSIEDSGLYMSDIEVLRLHYAKTLRCWRQGFESNKDRAEALYGEEFRRIWEFYLASSEVAFRLEHANVFQIQLARHQSALPQTRDYMFANEEKLRAMDSSGDEPKPASANKPN